MATELRSDAAFPSVVDIVREMVVDNLLARERDGVHEDFSARQRPSFEIAIDTLHRLSRIPRSASAERAFAVAFGSLPSEETRDALNYIADRKRALIQARIGRRI